MYYIKRDSWIIWYEQHVSASTVLNTQTVVERARMWSTINKMNNGNRNSKRGRVDKEQQVAIVQPTVYVRRQLSTLWDSPFF